MNRPTILILVILALLTCASTGAAQKSSKQAKPVKWEAFAGGWTVKTSFGLFHSTLDKKELIKIADRIAELSPAYEKHFGSKLKKGWTFAVFAERNQFEKYAKETTKGRLAVQGQCFRDQKILTILTAKRYG